MVFVPSRHRIEFLPKRMRQLKVEFIETNVLDHILSNMACVSFCAVFVAICQIDHIICGKERIKKQPTVREHVEIFF